MLGAAPQRERAGSTGKVQRRLTAGCGSGNERTAQAHLVSARDERQCCPRLRTSPRPNQTPAIGQARDPPAGDPGEDRQARRPGRARFRAPVPNTGASRLVRRATPHRRSPSWIFVYRQPCHMVLSRGITSSRPVRRVCGRSAAPARPASLSWDRVIQPTRARAGLSEHLPPPARPTGWRARPCVRLVALGGAASRNGRFAMGQSWSSASRAAARMAGRAQDTRGRGAC